MKNSYLDEFLHLRKELWATLEDLLRVVHLVGMESEAGKRCHERMKAIYKALGEGPTT